jgi:hypothetical protein
MRSLAMSLVIPIQYYLSPELSEDSYPHELNLDEVDSLTKLPFKSNYQIAQAAMMPYYLLSLLKVSAEGGSSTYQFVDAVALSSQVKPFKGMSLENVSYIALTCFDFAHANPMPMEIEALKKCSEWEPCELCEEAECLDALNYRLFSYGDEEQKRYVLDCQQKVRQGLSSEIKFLSNTIASLSTAHLLKVTEYDDCFQQLSPLVQKPIENVINHLHERCGELAKEINKYRSQL